MAVIVFLNVNNNNKDCMLTSYWCCFCWFVFVIASQSQSRNVGPGPTLGLVFFEVFCLLSFSRGDGNSFLTVFLVSTARVLDQIVSLCCLCVLLINCSCSCSLCSASIRSVLVAIFSLSCYRLVLTVSRPRMRCSGLRHYYRLSQTETPPLLEPHRERERESDTRTTCFHWNCCSCVKRQSDVTTSLFASPVAQCWSCTGS